MLHIAVMTYPSVRMRQKHLMCRSCQRVTTQVEPDRCLCLRPSIAIAEFSCNAYKSGGALLLAIEYEEASDQMRTSPKPE